MDFINKFTHRDEDEDANKKPSSSSEHGSGAVVQAAPAAHAVAGEEKEDQPKRNFLEQLIAGSGGDHHRHGAAADAADDDDERLSFLDRLTRKEDREKKMLELVKREAEVKFELDKVAREKKENEGLLGRIKDHFEGGGDDEGKPAEPSTKPSDDDQQHPSFLDKLTGKPEREARAAALDAREAELRAELARIEHDKRENLSVLERIRQRLDQDEAEGKSTRERDDDPSFFDKITGRAAEAERRRKEEESKSTLDKVKDRINEGMGGGRKAEKEEDMLDKTIDEFQEHVLHKGDQNNESALEQLKDEQIAAAIRGQLHLKEKKDDE